MSHGWRFTMLGYALAVWGAAIVGMAGFLMFGPQAQSFREQGALYSVEEMLITPPRGQVYDRWGNLLAGNVTVYEIGVNLPEVEDPEAIARAVNGVLGEDYYTLLERASIPAGPNAVYVVLANYVPAYKADILIDYVLEQKDPETAKPGAPSLAGLVFKPHLMRSYPERDLASNVLGFVNREGIGYFGIEQYYQDLLAGQPQRILVPVDPNLATSLPEVPPGASLVLTLDREIQAMVEDQLDLAVEFYGAKAGTVVIMDPETGEILAMASTPRLDLNEYWNYQEVYPGSTPFNRAVSKSYEPGSVFKVFTVAAALDSGTVQPSTSFFDTGVFQIGGITIRNWNSGAWGKQDITGCLRHSLNVCMAWLGSEMKADLFYQYLRLFGFGHNTGVDLAGEATGRLKEPGDDDWYEADLGTNTFGQGIAVTPIQMLMGISAIANEGQMVVPHLVRSMVEDGRQFNFHTQYAGQPISAETARTLTLMLAESLESEASNALVPGYRVAGKTGTAEIPTEFGYTSAITNASFVGWGPVDDPKFIVYVWLEEPSASIWGSETAAPLFAQIVERLVVLLNLPPDSIRAGLTSGP
ncbi:MAG: penicillin-binding protein 2 [Anaerolineae bacterium]|nr:MAG: penicillin-binding protein 2 [Anaerolineae bacterium]